MPSYTGNTILWPLDTVPSGFLRCDGSLLSKTTYSALYSKLGGIYGETLTHFNLPDVRGFFPRGYGATTVDPNSGTRTNRGDGTTGNAVGTRQTEEIAAHDHGHRTGPNGGTSATASLRAYTSGPYGVLTQYSGVESRPKNIYLMLLIKY